jgi:hypothetical protein
LSYIRTYQAGHAIPSYQPETAYKILTRALFNLDIATGTESTAGTDELNTYMSAGRADPDVQFEAFTSERLTYCYTWDAGSCTDEQVSAILDGSAEICQYLLVDANTTQLFPEVIAKCRQSGGNSTVPGGYGNNHTLPEFEGAAVKLGGSGWTTWLMMMTMVTVGILM